MQPIRAGWLKSRWLRNKESEREPKPEERSRGAEPPLNALLFKSGESKRGFASLLYPPLPLVKGKGIKGIGLPDKKPEGGEVNKS